MYMHTVYMLTTQPKNAMKREEAVKVFHILAVFNSILECSVQTEGAGVRQDVTGFTL